MNKFIPSSPKRAARRAMVALAASPAATSTAVDVKQNAKGAAAPFEACRVLTPATPSSQAQLLEALAAPGRRLTKAEKVAVRAMAGQVALAGVDPAGVQMALCAAPTRRAFGTPVLKTAEQRREAQLRKEREADQKAAELRRKTQLEKEAAADKAAALRRWAYQAHMTSRRPLPLPPLWVKKGTGRALALLAEIASTHPSNSRVAFSWDIKSRRLFVDLSGVIAGGVR